MSIAEAAEDGGTRSIFASGAGNRALGMGGAFVGVADDASAMFWNAGGLGRVQQPELQAMHTAYGDLGSRQESFSAVLPNWRWGTVGASILHYGIDGIESRDGGNLLLGSDLSNSESEIAVGYGRPLSGSMSVGATIKLQRQSLAGFSGSGLGADLGILGRAPAALRSRAAWAGRLAWGVSIRNILEPAVRLDRESVRDPSVLRTGIAYEHPMAGGRSVLLALDLEKSRGIGAKARAGLEVRVHPLLGIRAGLNTRRVSAGMGVTWRRFAVDYAFSDEDFAGIHRVGISRALGRSVPQQREAAVRARETALQARLDEAFQKRQEEQLEDLLTRVKSAEANGDYDKALEVLSTITILYPDRSDVPALEALCHREKGKQLEAKGDHGAAALAYGRAAAIAPGDTAAVAGQLRNRAETERIAAHTESLRRRAATTRDSLVADSVGSAASASSASGRTTLRKASAQAERASVAASQPAASRVPEHPRLSPEREREVERLYGAGLGAVAERRLDDALRYWEIAWSIAPGYKRLAEYLKREYLIRGMDSFASGKLDQAMAFWEKALQVDPEDSRAASYIARARIQQARTRELMGGGR